MLALGTLAVLVPVAASIIALERTSLEDPSNPSRIQPVQVRGSLAPGEAATLSDLTGAVPLELVTAAHGSDDAVAGQMLIGDCPALGVVVELATCDNGRFSLSKEAEIGFGRYLTGAPVIGESTRPAGYDVVATLFVGEDWRQVEATLRAHMVNRAQPGLFVDYTTYDFHEAPIAKWIIGGITMMAIITGLALLLHALAHSCRLACTRTRLRGLGMPKRTIGLLAYMESAMTIAISGLCAIVVGVTADWLFTELQPSAQMHVHIIALLVGSTVLSAAAIGAIAGWLVTTMDDQPPSLLIAQ
jgi:hypothetical protein